MRAAKQAAMAGLLRDYAALKQRWGPGVHTAGYDRLLGEAPNNALLASISAYGQLVPGFERLLAASGSLPAFYAEVERIAALPRAERCAALGVAVPAEAVGAGSRAVTGAALSSAGC